MEKQNDKRIYSHNGSTYRLKQLDLGILNKATPLLLRFRRLQFEYTKDIDDSELRQVQERIGEIKTALAQFEAGGTCDANEISGLRRKLSEAEAELKDNRKLQKQLELINDAESIALFELLTDEDLILPFLKSVLEPVNEEYTEISIKGPDAIELIEEVVTDFFGLTLRNKWKLQS